MTFRGASRRGFMVGMGATLLAGSRRSAVAAPTFKTVEPGVLTIANSNEMPMIAMEDGKLIGSDAEIIATIASKMGLGVKSAQMEWSATVQSVKSGRADIMLGNMGWTPARAAGAADHRCDLLRRHHGLHEEGQAFHHQLFGQRHEGPLDRHRERLHHRAGNEEGAGRRAK